MLERQDGLIPAGSQSFILPNFPKKFPAVLLDPAQYSRGQLHFQTTGEGDHYSEVACGNAPGISLRSEGAPGDHSYQAPQRDG